MEKIMSKITGKLKLSIDKKEIYANNKVNNNFMLCANGAIDEQFFSAAESSIPQSMRLMPIIDFSLMMEDADMTMQSIYTEMANISISNFKCIQADLFKTTFKASGTISNSGIIKSAGFNVARNITPTTLPNVSTPKRYVKITLPQPLPTLPSYKRWVYHFEKKAFYNFEVYPNIYKLPYDIETGIIGEVSTIATNWIVENPSITSSSMVINCTDGKNLKFATRSASSSKSLGIFDFRNESVRFINWDTQETWRDYFRWDEELGVLRGLNTGRWIGLDGSLGTNLPKFNIPSQGNGGFTLIYKKNYILSTYGAFAYVPTGQKQLTDQRQMQYGTYLYDVDRPNYIKNDNGISVYGNFAANQPNILKLEIIEEPKLSMTILSLPELSVSAGQSFEVEYSFEITE